MNLEEYISPALLVLLPVLYALGGALKKSRLPDYIIPFVIGAAGVVFACIWLLSRNYPSGIHDLLKTLLMGFVQGLICASVTVYAHNLVKQYKKRDEK